MNTINYHQIRTEVDPSMKRLVSVMIALILVLALCLGYASADVAALEGTYTIDATPLGMPLTVFLMIDSNGNFQLTNKAENGADKGHGQIGEQDGLFLMVYSDSTNDALKTATFTLEGSNLLFSTRLPYGSSGFAPNTSDENNIIYPLARKMLFTDCLGTYVGSLEVDAMGSAVTYNAELTLLEGAEYALLCTFDMGGSIYTYEQAGTFAIENGSLKLTCTDREGQAGTLTDDGITASLFLSSMASSPRDIVLQKATTAEVAGVYTGSKSFPAQGFSTDAVLTLNAVGGYTYTARIEGEDDYNEAGTFTVEGSVLVLTPDGGDPIECTLENDILSAKMRINDGVPMSTLITFYNDRIQGVFTATAEDEAYAGTAGTLTLNPDGTYSIVVTVNDEMTYGEEGTFTTEPSMAGVSLVLTAADGTVSTGIVSSNININHNVDAAFNTLGFKYYK